MSDSRAYTLKPMILARVLAELSVLLILLLLPLALLLSEQLQALHFLIKLTVWASSPVAGLIFYHLLGTVIQVKIEESGLSLRSFISRKSLKWQEIRTVKRVRRFSCPEIMLETTEKQTITFPAMLDRSNELLEQIKQRLPGQGRSAKKSSESKYKVSPSSLIADSLKLCFQLLLLGLFLSFAFNSKGSSSQEDYLVILAAATTFSAVMLWRIYQFLLTPFSIELDGNRLIYRNCIFQGQIQLDHINKLQASSPIFPEGIFLLGAGKRVLISSAIDSYDEALEEISDRLSKQD